MERLETCSGEVVWTPPAAFVERSPLARYQAWLAENRGLRFEGYDALWAWSTGNGDAFWHSLWDYFALIADGEPTTVVEGAMPRAVWFPGTRVNYAEHVLRHEHDGDPARAMFRHSSELRPMAEASWQDVAAAVRRLATRLRALGIRPGDRVVAFMPNIIETVVAMLAATAIGAVWSSAAPEFGVNTVVDRFGQLQPRLIFVADGYRYGGKDFDRRDTIAAIVAAVGTIETVVWLDYLGTTEALPALAPRMLRWEDLLSGPPVPAAAFAFERVDSRHPLWVLFSSGTTGLPKGIVHNHHGILLESYKGASFHFNMKPGDCLFFYSTTGWMMWNSLMNAPLVNATAVLFDGHPSHPDPARLWELADQAGATVFGTNPTVTQIMKKLGIAPGEKFRLERLEAVLLIGSPATPEAFAWVYDNVKPGLWVTSQSGGTEFCSGLLGGVPELPVRAGMIQAPCLGMDVHVFNDDGEAVLDEPGELVVTSPAPSMPLRLWGDDDDSRYRAAYFDRWPGVWMHGDSAQINSRGGCCVFGRSDATLNRFGVRIGSAEIYRTLENVDGVHDSLVVCIEENDGGYFMPLFVALAPGRVLDDALKSEIVRRLRTERSPRHVPDVIVAAPGVPMTITGKKMEVPVRRLLMGVDAEKAFSAGATKEPAVMQWYVDFARARLAGKAAALVRS